MGHASEVYIYFTILLASEAFYNFFNAFARYLKFTDSDLTGYMQLIDSPVWEFRAVFHLFILSVIIGRMTLRAIATLRKVRRFKVEENNVPDTNRRRRK